VNPNKNKNIVEVAKCSAVAMDTGSSDIIRMKPDPPEAGEQLNI